MSVTEWRREHESTKGYRAFRVKARKWVIILTQGRALNFTLNAYVWLVSVTILFMPTNEEGSRQHLTGLLVFSLLVKLPFILAHIVLFMLNFGTLLQLDNHDFAAVIGMQNVRGNPATVMPLAQSQQDKDTDPRALSEKEKGRRSSGKQAFVAVAVPVQTVPMSTIATAAEGAADECGGDHIYPFGQDDVEVGATNTDRR
jgi:hypothetical protein